MTGKLIVIEGPDGLGKTTLALRLAESVPNGVYYAFPGKEEGTIGQVVYDIHHEPDRFGLTHMLPETRQLLHVVAHIESIRTRIRPWLDQGKTVILDRYWWSTWVYGLVYGVEPGFVRAIVELELSQGWNYRMPDLVVLLDREQPFREHSEDWLKLRQTYWQTFIQGDTSMYPVQVLPVQEGPERVYQAMARLLSREFRAANAG